MESCQTDMNQYSNLENDIFPSLFPFIVPSDCPQIFKDIPLAWKMISLDFESHTGYSTVSLAPPWSAESSAQHWLRGKHVNLQSPAPPPATSGFAWRSPLQCLVLLTLWNMAESHPKLLKLWACFALLKHCNGCRFPDTGRFSKAIWTQILWKIKQKTDQHVL